MMINWVRELHSEEIGHYSNALGQTRQNFVIRHVLLCCVVVMGCYIAQEHIALVFFLIYISLSLTERNQNAALATRHNLSAYVGAQLIFTMRMLTYRAFVIYLWTHPNPAAHYPALFMLIAGLLFSLNRGSGLRSHAAIQSAGDSLMFLFIAASFLAADPTDSMAQLSSASALAVMLYHLLILKETHAANRATLEFEERNRQSQKMEAVGRLTGGVAHDFNNILTVVMGNLELYKEETDPAEKDALAGQAFEAAQRASVLTAQLLAFSRKSPMLMSRVDVPVLLGRFEELAKRVLPSSVAMEMHIAQDIWPIKSDPNQLENALLNLAINARDAMPKGGRLRIKAENIRLERKDPLVQHPGRYVRISVADTGEGIARDKIEHVFEPFFTTKDVGQGSGLGLSMVKGFSEQSGGGVSIDSRPDHGTTVALVLPVFTGVKGLPYPHAQLEEPQNEA